MEIAPIMLVSGSKADKVRSVLPVLVPLTWLPTSSNVSWDSTSLCPLPVWLTK